MGTWEGAGNKASSYRERSETTDAFAVLVPSAIVRNAILSTRPPERDPKGELNKNTISTNVANSVTISSGLLLVPRMYRDACVTRIYVCTNEFMTVPIAGFAGRSP
jgi:hypothetical protein